MFIALKATRMIALKLPTPVTLNLQNKPQIYRPQTRKSRSLILVGALRV